MKINYCALLFSIVLLFSSCTAFQKNEQPVSVVINEVMTSNYQLYYDKNDETSDWIEIKNTGIEPVDITGWGLSDSDKNPFKFIFPRTIIDPGSYLIIRCSGKGSPTERELHTSFKLKSAGEKILLTNDSGSIVESLSIPELEENASYGRPFSSPETFVVLSEPTPGKANTDEFIYTEQVNPVQSSLLSYWCEEGTPLTLSCETQESVIHYTLDGSEPDLSSPVYRESMILSKNLYPAESLTEVKEITENYYPPDITWERGLVIRAKAYVKGYKPSEVFTQTVFFSDIQKDQAFPSVFITVDPEDLTDESGGVYVLGDVYKEWRKKNAYAKYQGDSPANYNQRGGAWRKNSHIEFVDDNGSFSIPSVFKIVGGWSRASPQKPFQIFFYKKGDAQTGLTYSLFPGLSAKDGSSRPVNFFRSVIFRNGGNDYNYTLYRDSLLQSQVSSLPVETQASRPSVIYLNGEYWGILNMREAYDESYFYNHYGIPLDQSTVYEYGGDLRIGSEEDFTWYRTLLSEARSTDFTKADALDQFKNRIDFQNHALYTAIQIYIANKDWPGNNIRFWKTESSPVRWLLYDTEFSSSIYEMTHFTLNMFNIINQANGPDWPNPPWSTELIRICLKNPEYQRLLINASCDLMNTVFKTEEINAAVDDMIELYKPGMQNHWDRWIWAAGGAEKQWLQNSGTIKTFFSERPAYYSRQMEAFFNLDKPVSIQVSSGKGGKVILNTVTLTNETLTGNYYPGRNISLKAVPDEGYKFSKWTGSIESSESSILVNPEEGLSVRPVFTK